MRITISGKNVEITDALREQITKKVSKLERYFDENKEVQLTMTVENRHIMEVTIPSTEQWSELKNIQTTCIRH